MPDFKSERTQLEVIQKSFLQKNYSEALVATEKLLQEFPLSFQGKFFFTRILRALGRMQEARNLLVELDKQYPYNISILSELAGILFAQKEFQESLIYYHRILFLDSFNNEAKQKVEEIQQLIDQRFEEELDETQVDHQRVSGAEADRDRKELETEVPPETQPIPLLHKKAEPIPELDLHLGDTGDFSPYKAPTGPIPKKEEPAIVLTKDMPEEVMALHLGDTGEFPAVSGAGEEEKPESPEPRIKAETEKDELLVIEPEPIGGPPPLEEEAPPAPEVSSIEIPSEQDQISIAQSAAAELGPEKSTSPLPVSGKDIPIATESAANLYKEQGLFQDAAEIFKRLYEQTSDEKYLNQYIDLERRFQEMSDVQQRTIAALESFLEGIRRWEKKNVQ